MLQGKYSVILQLTYYLRKARSIWALSLALEPGGVRERKSGGMGRSSCQASRICCNVSTGFIRGLYIRVETSLDLLRTLPDIEDLLEPLERSISHALIPAITGHTYTPAERDLLALQINKINKFIHF